MRNLLVTLLVVCFSGACDQVREELKGSGTERVVAVSREYRPEESGTTFGPKFGLGGIKFGLKHYHHDEFCSITYSCAHGGFSVNGSDAKTLWPTFSSGSFEIPFREVYEVTYRHNEPIKEKFLGYRHFVQ